MKKGVCREGSKNHALRKDCAAQIWLIPEKFLQQEGGQHG
jgi:hypothetical protein